MNIDFRRAIGERLRQARTVAKLTQQDVATDCRRSRQAVSSWERGETLPTLEEFSALAALYGVSADRILYQVDDVEQSGKVLLARVCRPDDFAQSEFGE